MHQRTMQVVGAVAFVAVVGVVAFFIASRFAGGEASGQQVEQPADWADDLRDRLEPTIQADKAQPPARGALGDFLIVGLAEAEPKMEVPCPRSPDRSVEDTKRIQQSELYSPRFQDNLEVYDCPDGTINFIGGTIRHETGISEFGRFLFVGDAIVESEAPRGRLQLTTVAGNPALLERGLDLSPFPSQTRIFVIERVPTEARPGIMLVVFTPLGADEGLQLAEELAR